MEIFLSIIGILAACCTTFGFIPQIIKGFRVKHLDDVSLTMLIVFFIGQSLWFYYGFAIKDPIIMGANAVAMALVIVLVIMKQIYKSHSKKKK